jgi:hypothetical protein
MRSPYLVPSIVNLAALQNIMFWSGLYIKITGSCNCILILVNTPIKN